jgi:hypothetical protein
LSIHRAYSFCADDELDIRQREAPGDSVNIVVVVVVVVVEREWK